MKKKHKIDATSINKDELISSNQPIFKNSDIDIFICSKPLTEADRKEISEFIANEKKRLQQEGKIAST